MVSSGSAGPPRSKTSHPPKGNEGFDRAHRGGLRAPSYSRPRPLSHPLPSLANGVRCAGDQHRTVYSGERRTSAYS
jgi:hypothetical protein